MVIAISLPIHESIETVVNQIDNYNKFVPNAIIVLHACSFWVWDNIPEKKLLKQYDNVVINPDRLPTQHGNGLLLDVHNSNFKFAFKNFKFDYFALHSSNDMFVKHGVFNYISKHNAGFAKWKLDDIFKLISTNQELVEKLKAKSELLGMDMTKTHPAMTDPALQNILKRFNITEIFGSQIEGSFYHVEIFKEMVNEINKFYSYKDKQIPVYAREEFYYPTVASKLVKTQADVYTLFNWQNDLTIELIKDIISNNTINIEESKYNSQNIFNVKRVERSLNNPIRQYISNL